MRPDIAFFIPTLAGGGAEKVFLTLANGFVRRGYTVDLVVGSATGPFLADIADAISLHDLRTHRISHGLRPLINYLRHRNPRVLISALGHCNLLALIANFLAGSNTAIYVTEHNMLSTSLAKHRLFKRLLLLGLMKALYPIANRVIAVSSGVAFDLERTLSLDRRTLCVIHNPIDLSEIAILADEPVYHSWFTDPNKHVIISVGRLVQQKDYTLLINAFAHVSARRPVRLIIIGEGPERTRLEQLVNSLGLQADVDFLGFQHNPYNYVRHSDLFVLSSAWEGFSVVLAEALACGTSVLSTDCPSGPSEILEGGIWGRLVPVGDVSAMANGIVELLDSPLQIDCGTRARDFAVPAILERYRALLFAEDAPITDVKT